MSSLGSGGVSPVPGGAQGNYPQYPGIFYGSVSNNADPLKKNRCLLRIPQLFGSSVSTWAVSLTPQQNPPAVGTLIAAMFVGGDLDYPCYLVVNPKLQVETTAGNIKPVATGSSAGTSVKYAAADHVHGNISTSAADISTITQGATAAPGASGRIADASHVHAMGTLNYLPAGSGGFLDIVSSQVTSGDTQAEIQMSSRLTAGQTSVTVVANSTELTGTLTVDGSTINIGGTASITPSNFNMFPLMATPPNMSQINAGTASAAQICAFLSSWYAEFQNRGMAN